MASDDSWRASIENMAKTLDALRDELNAEEEATHTRTERIKQLKKDFDLSMDTYKMELKKIESLFTFEQD